MPKIFIYIKKKDFKYTYLIFQKAEIGFESQYQLVLQLVNLWQYGLPRHGKYLDVTIRILSLATSYLSWVYGGSSVSLRSLIKREPEMLETISYSCLGAFRKTTILLVRISCLVLMFVTLLIYSNLIGLVIFLFIGWLNAIANDNPELIEQYKKYLCTNLVFTLMIRIMTRVFDELKSLADLQRWKKYNLKCNSLISFIGILISIVYLTLLYACSIVFINFEEEYKEDGQRRTMNFSLTLLVASVLSLLQNICEHLSISYRNKSFMDWVFLLALEEPKKLNAGEENFNLESGILKENIDPNEAEIIQQSIIETIINKDEEIIVMSVHPIENDGVNSEPGHLMEDIDPNVSEIIQQSTNETRFHQDQEPIVVSVHANENEKSYQLNEASEMKEGDIDKQRKKRANENENPLSDNLKEDNNLKVSLTIRVSINESGINKDEDEMNAVESRKEAEH